MRYIYFVLFFSLLGVSCSDDFLNEEPNDSIPLSEAITSESDMETAIVGLMSGFQSSTLYGRDLMVYSDVVADNVFISATNSNRFNAFDRRQYTTLNGNVANTWLGLYDQIKDANFIIQEGSQLSETANRNFYLGQAYIARALSHFELVKFYAKQPATGENQELGVPYVTIFDAFQTLPRNSVSEVYGMIEDDLTTAISLMEGQTVDNIFLGVDAANLLLSRLHLYNENFPQALIFANKVIDESGLDLVSTSEYAAYWGADSSQGETIFQVSLTTDDNPGFDQLAYIYDSEGYAQNLAYESFVNTFSDADVRKMFTLADGRGDDPVGYYVGKWPYSGSAPPDIKILRLAEAYLNASEAAYYATSDQAARDLLQPLLNNRYTTNQDISGLSDEDLLDRILEERRKELAFENHRLFDLIRNGMPVNKDTNCTQNCTLSATADILTFPIPDAEFDGNPNMVQNPGYQ